MQNLRARRLEKLCQVPRGYGNREHAARDRRADGYYNPVQTDTTQPPSPHAKHPARGGIHTSHSATRPPRLPARSSRQAGAASLGREILGRCEGGGLQIFAHAL